ncbi:MAG TPA: RDD family protein [Polyangia bacterium]|jgi:uncharacterized RDD family membrane protein YckC
MTVTATATGAVAPVNPGHVAGFWIRVLADLLDAAFLWLFGLLLSFPFESVFGRLGEDGVFIGLAVSLTYAGVLQSRIGGGQTLAKRFLGLKVVRLDGALLSLDRSLLRYAAVSFMIYQHSIDLAAVKLLPFLRIEWVAIVSGTLSLVLFLGCVLVVPFHPLKRGLHDLLAGTIVVRKGMPDPPRLQALHHPQRDRIVVVSAGALFAVSTIISFVLARPAASLPAGVARPAQLAPEVPLRNATITDTVALTGDRRTRTVVVNGFLSVGPDGARPDFARAHRALTDALRQQLPADSSVDNIGTNLRSGWDIGIRRSFHIEQQIEDRRTGAAVSTIDSRLF